MFTKLDGKNSATVLPYKHTLKRKDKPTNKFLSTVIILLLSKFMKIKELNPLKVFGAKLTIWFDDKSSNLKLDRPLNVFAFILTILLNDKRKIVKGNPANVKGSITLSEFDWRYNSLKLIKPLNMLLSKETSLLFFK